MASPYLLVGLGNPGPRYAQTWHNYGFMFLEYLSQSCSIPIRRAQHHALVGKGTYKGEQLILACPQTFMNESGLAVQALVSYYKIPHNHLLLIYDDLDTPVGQLRLRPFGGSGTHNGMRSVLQHLQAQDFPRLRMGIGPKPARMDLADYVLSPIPQEQQKAVFSVLEQAAKGLDLWLEKGLEAAMNELNRKGPEKRPQAHQETGKAHE